MHDAAGAATSLLRHGCARGGGRAGPRPALLLLLLLHVAAALLSTALAATPPSPPPSPPPSNCGNTTLLSPKVPSGSFYVVTWFDLQVIATSNVLVTNLRFLAKLPNPTTIGAYVIPGASLWNMTPYSGPLCSLPPVDSFPQDVTGGAGGSASITTGNPPQWLYYPGGGATGQSAVYYLDVPLNYAFAAGTVNTVGIAIQSQGGPDACYT